MKRTLSLILAILMLLPLIACNSGDEGGDESGNAAPENLLALTKDFVVVSDGELHDVIRHELSSSVIKGVRAVYDVKMTGDTDTYRGSEPIEDIRNEYELLLGDTNRKESIAAMETIGEGEYAYGASEDGKTVYLVWKGNTLVSDACVADFMKNCIGYDTETESAVEGGATTPLTLGMSVKRKFVSPFEEIAALGCECGEAHEGNPVKSLTLGGVSVNDYSVVYGEDGTGESKYNAEEFAKYVEMATGITLPVIPESESAEHEIVIGASSRDTDNVISRRETLENDGIMYYFEDDRLYITGKTALGEKFAVYRFLEEKLGVRFYSSEYEKVLPSDGIDIPAELDYTYSPKLAYRDAYWADAQVNGFKLKLGLNADIGIENTILGFAHTLGYLAETVESEGHVNPCLTDENIYQTVLKNVRKQLSENPGAKIISVTQMDGDDYCICSRCMEIAQAENMSGLNLTFVNRLADDIKDEYPDVTILTFAYVYTRKPPKTVVARDNVMIWFCTIECCFSHTLDDPSCKQNAALATDIAGWHEFCPRMYIWDYTTNYYNYCMPFANLHVLRDNMEFFLENNALGIFEQGGYQQRENGEFAQLRAYLLSHLLWDPDMTDEEYYAMMDEFLREYYGCGWKYIRHYIDYSSAIAATQHMGIYFNVDDYLLEYTDYSLMLGLWESAIAAAHCDATRRHCTVSSIQARLLPGNHDPNGTDIIDMMHEFGITRKNERNEYPIPDMTYNYELGYSNKK